MMGHHLELFLLAEGQLRTYLDLARLHQFTQWWHWTVFAGVTSLLLLFIVWMYRRDTIELPRGVRWALTLLRLVAFAGLILFFLDLEKRSERELTRTSRVAVLVDASQSMGLVDSSAGATVSRLSEVVDEFSRGEILPRLREKHDVSVYRFDQASAPQQIASFPKLRDEQIDVANGETLPRGEQVDSARRMLSIAGYVAVAAILCFLVQAFAGAWLRGAEGEAYLLLGGTVGMIIALTLGAVTLLRYPSLSLAELRTGVATEQPKAPSLDEASLAGVSETREPKSVRWSEELVPRGAETRLGEAVGWVLQKERGGSLAGIVVLTDGQSNAGTTPKTVAKLAKSAEIPLYPVGMGSEKQPRSVRLVDLEMPPRVFPGDRFEITGYVQADGLAGRTVEVSLEQSTVDGQPVETPERFERRLTLGDDGQIVAVKFDVVPERVGRQQWTMQIRTQQADDLDARDNRRQGAVQVIERKTRVLLLAGGPTREYRFVRNLLFRDMQTNVDVLLQTAPVGAAQEANQVLLEFPNDRDAMFSYDCVVAFDPDWTRLTIDHLRLLDEWVAERAGGLILVAGPVYTAGWSRGIVSSEDQPTISMVKNLYPVTFYRTGSATIQLGRVGSDTPWPLAFTDEGRRAQFLWLDDSPTASQETWREFEGVYGYQALRGIKPGAQVYARFSDPESGSSDELPVYMAGQFYGGGRLFYLGSGEMWRLNALDPRYFETFYTKLIRHVSQGRLLRDSSRGLLLVDSERVSLGDTINVRAVLSDAQYQPLTLDRVSALLVGPDGQPENITLDKLSNAERPGMYTTQFTAKREGDYRIDLTIPDSVDEILSREVKVRLPAREIERPQRNDAALLALARQTDGRYFVGLSSARGDRGAVPLTNQILAKDLVSYLPGTPDRDFERRWMTWLMATICGALSLEWLIRRLYKLA